MFIPGKKNLLTYFLRREVFKKLIILDEHISKEQSKSERLN